MTETIGWWNDLEDVIDAGVDRVLLYGPPGTGKTVAALRAGVTGEPERLICTEDMTSGEVTGMWMPNSRGTLDWQLGPAIRAWGDPGVDTGGTRLVLDEIDRASGDAMASILAAVDSIESAHWRNPQTGVVHRPGSNFSVVATSNVEVPEQLASALLDRFPVRLKADRPHPDALRGLHEDLREVAIAGSLAPTSRRLSLRAMFAFAQLRDELGAERAAQLVVGMTHAQEFLDALVVAQG